VLLIAITGIWALLWGAVVDRLYLGVDEISLSIADKKIKISFTVAVIRSVLWFLSLNLANFLITGVVCKDVCIHKIFQCIESSEKLQSFWMFSNAIVIILALTGILFLELGGDD